MATEIFNTLTPAQIAADLNDATRALMGGFWSQNVAGGVNEGNQGAGSLARYQTDLTNIQSALNHVTNPTSQVTHILADITVALQEAPLSIGGDAAAAQAQAALRAAHLDILAQTTGDAQLNAAGVVQAPATLADPLHAPHATFEQIGQIFNDLVSRSLGGLTPATAHDFTKEVATIERDLTQFVNQHPADFTGLTSIHVETIINQLELQKSFDGQYGHGTLAGRTTNDNLLDIIDIVQGDTTLAGMAGAGWSAAPAALHPTTPYQDNAAQTNFWAGFIASSNALGDAGVQLVGSGDKGAIRELIQDLKIFESNVQKFDASQGGIFEARFDNELLGNKSTTGAEVAAMIQGLKTGDATLVAAAANEMHANAADVSGNNIPVNGGTFNTDGRTIAVALNMTTPPSTPATPLAPTPPTLVAGDHHDHHDQQFDTGHLGHMWG